MLGQSKSYNWCRMLIAFLCVGGSIVSAHAQTQGPTCQPMISYANSAIGGDHHAEQTLAALAAKGNSLAQVLSAIVISNKEYSYQWYTIGVFSKDQKSIFYAKEAADNGYPLGQVLYGFMSLMMAHSYPVKDKHAVASRGYRYIRMGLPSVERHLKGPCASLDFESLASLSFYGIVVPRSMAHVLHFELRAAHTGWVPAIGGVGTLYAMPGTAFYNPTKAAEWTRRAAKDGYLPSITRLGFFYAHGEGVKKSYAKAFSLYQRAAARGFPPAEYHLSLAYFDGRGTPVNRKRARKLVGQAMVYKPADTAMRNELFYSLHTEIRLGSRLFTDKLLRNRQLAASFRRFEKDNGLKPVHLFDAG